MLAINLFIMLFFIFCIIKLIEKIGEKRTENQYNTLSRAVLRKMGFSSWEFLPEHNLNVKVKSRSALEKYDDITFFKSDKHYLDRVTDTLKSNKEKAATVKTFLEDNEFKSHPQYYRVENKLKAALHNAENYCIRVDYITSAGNNLGTRLVHIDSDRLARIKNDPSLLMSKTEYSQFIKEQREKNSRSALSLLIKLLIMQIITKIL